MNAFSNKIAIYGSRRQDPYLRELDGLFSFLDEAGFKVVIHQPFADYLIEKGVNMAKGIPVLNIPSDTVMVISIGGDGTFLRAARWIGDKGLPIFGINTGHLGFLSSCSLKDAREMITDVCTGNIIIEKRMLLKVECEALPQDIWNFALNEIAVLRDELSSIISVKTSIDGVFLADYRADGLIISTPTGSTAYSLSAGGPILQPTINCIALSPIAPHTLTLRPLVVGGDSKIEMEAESRSKNIRLNIDDRSYRIPAGQIIRVKRADFPVLLIRKKASDFASILRDKLLWSARGEGGID